MNLKETATLTGLLMISNGCMPDLKHPEVRARLEGTYQRMLDGNKVSYKVSKESCIALVDFGTGITIIVDNDCDNIADFMNFNDRKYLIETGKAEDVDFILKTIQKELVKPEYKVK
ncbi:MAG: hypothetical protein Q8R47_00320 [Nanoarchaeota archaeon]|nr:hypothetical protein [Nanoarchaeota archaeon]